MMRAETEPALKPDFVVHWSLHCVHCLWNTQRRISLGSPDLCHLSTYIYKADSFHSFTEIKEEISEGKQTYVHFGKPREGTS